MNAVTKEFMGSPDTWRDAKIELDDIHDVWGGKCITVYGDGTTFVKIVDLGQTAETYRMELDEEQVPRLFEAVLRNDVLSLADGAAQPGDDEVRTRLSVTNARGETRTICHWELSSTDERFEDARNELSSVLERMGELGARLVATVSPTPTEAPTGESGEAGFGAGAANSHAEFSLPDDHTSDLRSPLRALQAVGAFFTEDGWSFEQMPERPILRLPFQGKGGRWNCYAQVRVTKDVEQVLFYSVLPLNVPAEKRAAIAEFITRANYGMALGNFELDFNDGEVRYKTSVDVTDQEINPGLLRPLIYTNVLMMDKYMSGLIAVVYADVSPSEAVRQIEG
jgi:hypothetical protein